MNHENKNITHMLYDDDIGKVQLIESWGTDLTVVNSARVSFGVQKDELGERDKKLISYLIKHKHTSTLEHCGVTFKFVVPLYVANQHMRHRTWSYNSISRRYTDVNIKFYEPKEFRTQHKSNRQASNAEELIDPQIISGQDPYNHGAPYFDPVSKVIRAHHGDSLGLFNRLIEAGVCREQARGVLPQNLYTEYYGTVNLSNLLKFIDLRTHEGAQWEIQKVAEACLEIATDLFPVTVGAYRRIRSEE
mgnify:CR=1 FL=1